MKLFEMEGFLRGKCFPGDMRVNETNAEYLVRKFAEADVRCAALAAENAGLKAAAIFLADEAAEIYRRWNLIQQPDGDIIDMQTISELKCACHETPTTDAILAEVRAQGVDELAELYLTLARHEANRSIAESWRESARFAKDHADQIRKGVQS
jgi:hypothetical protein